MELKEVFYSNLRTHLYDIVDADKLNITIDRVMLALAPYELHQKCTDVVIYDNGDADMLKGFFIAKAAQGLSERSLLVYRDCLKRFIAEVGKHIKDINTDDVRIYLTKKRIDGSSASYIDTIRRYLSSFFKWLRRERMIDENPIERIPNIRVARKIERPFSEEQLESLRVAAKSIRNKCIIEFLYSTACRVDEMTKLNRQDIDFDNNQALVNGKGGKERFVYFSSRCKMLLLDYLKSRTDTLDALFVSDWSDWKSGSHGETQRISNSCVRDVTKKCGKIANIENCHPHRFRKTAATLAMKRGMKITDVQRMLGHSDIKTTTIYAITLDDDVKTAHEKYII